MQDIQDVQYKPSFFLYASDYCKFTANKIYNIIFYLLSIILTLTLSLIHLYL